MKEPGQPSRVRPPAPPAAALGSSGGREKGRPGWRVWAGVGWRVPPGDSAQSPGWCLREAPPRSKGPGRGALPSRDGSICRASVTSTESRAESPLCQPLRTGGGSDGVALVSSSELWGPGPGVLGWWCWALGGSECGTPQGTVSRACGTLAPIRAQRHRAEGSLLGGSREPARERDFAARPCGWGAGLRFGTAAPVSGPLVVSCLECAAQGRGLGCCGPRDTSFPALFALGLLTRLRDSLPVQWLGLRASTARDVGSVPS